MEPPEGRGRSSIDSARVYALAWAFYMALAVAGVVWLGLREGFLGTDLFFDPSRWWVDVGLGLLAAAALVGVWAGAARWVPPVRTLEQRLRATIGDLSTADAVGIAVLSGFAEELFFRGAVQASLGWPLATLLFALLHTGRERVFWLWTGFAAGAGLVFAALTLWTGNLAAAIVAHVVVNAVNLPRIAGAGRES